MKLALQKKYSFPEIVDDVGAHADGLVDGYCELDEGDLALVVHLGKYFKRRFSLAIRGQINAMKLQYDGEGEAYKTPYALRDFENEEERAWILANLIGFATTHGCTGSCAWCCYDALPVDAKNLVVTPLPQKLHFFDEFIAVASKLGDDGAIVLVKKLFLHGDNDSFDDPDIVSLVTYLYDKVAVLPQLSTVLPKSGEANFKYLTALARRFSDMKILANFSMEFQILCEKAKVSGLDGMAEGLAFAEKQRALEILETFLQTLSAIQHLDLMTRRLVLAGNAEAYNFALGFFNLGSFDDYVQQSGEKFGEVRSVIDDNRDVGMKGEFDWRKSLPLLRDLYEDTLKRMGIDFSSLRFNDAVLADLKVKLLDMFQVLQGKPDLGALDSGRVRISVVKSREALVRELKSSGEYLFQTEDRDVKVTEDRVGLRLSGLSFAKSGAEVGEHGITCKQGMELTPFGLFNAVPGLVTREYPQGRVVVPFRGLQPDNALLKEGDFLAEALDRVIVLNRGHFSAESTPEVLFVYDGDANIRKIHFDERSYRVKSDNVVEANAVDISVLRDLRARDFE
ncbi:hypothetical protein HY605_03690 [Candidatus Peregrinibacteria bacterium]|nr:hypothetical protein [Candidatus Peregrinibacteria bacterium]